MNMFKRWYDADSVVSRAINELEKSSEEIQVRCADYIIDLLKDVELEELSLDDQYNYIMRRWYDKNVKVSHAMEYIKHAPEELRHELALDIIEYIEKMQKECEEQDK